MSTDEKAIDIVKALNEFGLTNPFLQAAILSIVYKETNFVLGRENMNYNSAQRLAFVFPSYFPDVDSAMPYVKNPQALANKVYGGKYGNTGPDDGWLYRGSGWNGLTFKSNYEKIGKMIGEDLVNHPELMNDITIASKALAAYNKMALENSGGRLQSEVGANDINDFSDIETAVRAAMRATAGWKSSTSGNIFKEGEQRALEVAPGFYNLIRTLSPEAIAPDKKKKKKPLSVVENFFSHLLKNRRKSEHRAKL